MDVRKDYQLDIISRTILTLIVFAIAALPAIAANNLFLVDYPEHLAAFHILNNIASSGDLQQYYSIRDGMFPYWGIRVPMAVLTPLLGVEPAMRVFATLALLMPAAGACVLGWTLSGRMTLLPLVSLAFIYNGPFDWGFVNFSVTAGFALMCFSAWIASTGKPSGLRYAALVIAATVMIWLHPVAFILFAMMCCFWDLAGWVEALNQPGRLKRFLQVVTTGLCFVPAGLSLIALTAFQSDGPQFLMGNMAARLWIAATPFWMDDSLLNFGIGVAALASLIGLVIAGWATVNTRAARVSIYMLISAYAMPMMMFGVLWINMRVPVFALLIFIASLELKAADTARVRAVICTAIVLLAGKLTFAWSTLHSGALKVKEYREVARSIPQGAKVLTVLDRTAKLHPGARIEVNYQNLSSYLIVDLHAFVPDIFASVEIAHSPQFEHRKAPLWKLPPDLQNLAQPLDDLPPSERIDARYLDGWRDFYEYLIVFDFGSPSEALSGTTQIARAKDFQILKVEK